MRHIHHQDQAGHDGPGLPGPAMTIENASLGTRLCVPVSSFAPGNRICRKL